MHRGYGIGITPACAGKSAVGCCRCFWGRDHPRVCGEKLLAVVGRERSEGSPPRVRGKVLQAPKSNDYAGITPACAGKRGELERCRRRSEDHPRVCGEKIYGKAASVGTVGSPPRVRGKERLGGGDLEEIGITPACAGKRKLEKTSETEWRDHPRVCGEKGRILTRRVSLWGSPPRVRGKVN